MILLQEKMTNVLERLAKLEANASTNKSEETSDETSGNIS